MLTNKIYLTVLIFLLSVGVYPNQSPLQHNNSTLVESESYNKLLSINPSFNKEHIVDFCLETSRLAMMLELYSKDRHTKVWINTLESQLLLSRVENKEILQTMPDFIKKFLQRVINQSINRKEASTQHNITTTYLECIQLFETVK